MKSNIIKILSAAAVETIVRLQQVSNVIASASSVIDEVTVEAQVMLQAGTAVLSNEDHFLSQNH